MSDDNPPSGLPPEAMGDEEEQRAFMRARLAEVRAARAPRSASEAGAAHAATLVGVGDHWDFERLMRRCSSGFLRVVDSRGPTAYVGTRHGLWARLDRKDDHEALGRLRQLLELARLTDAAEVAQLMGDDFDAAKARFGGALEVLRRRIGVEDLGRFAMSVAQRIVSGSREADNVPTIPMQQFNNRTLNPVVPLIDGGAWNVATNSVVAAADLLPMHMMHLGWSVPEPLPGDGIAAASQSAERLARLFGAGGPFGAFLDRCAAYLVGVAKAVDVVSGEPNTGKSRAAHAMGYALPGAFVVLQAPTVLHPGSTRFTPVEEHLRRCLGVFVDETDKVRPDQRGVHVPSAIMNPWVASEMTIEIKGIQPFTQRRMGTVCLISNGWPKFDAQAGGVSARLRWALDLREAESMGPGDWLAFEDPQAQAWLRAQLFAKAHAWSAGDPWLVTESRRLDAEEMLAASLPELAVELRDHYEADAGGFVSNEEIKETFGDSLPRRAELAYLMRCAFGGGVRTGTKRVGGKVKRGWHGMAVLSQTANSTQMVEDGDARASYS